MNALLKKTTTALALVAAFAVAPAQAAVIGNLNNGQVHNGAITGYWSLMVNQGDFVTITARRLSSFDPIALVRNGPNGTGIQVAYGDDNIGANPGFGGGYGDPHFSFTAQTTGQYSVGVFRFGSGNAIENLAYSVHATGATGSVPLPGTLLLMGAAFAGLGFARRKQA